MNSENQNFNQKEFKLRNNEEIEKAIDFISIFNKKTIFKFIEKYCEIFEEDLNIDHKNFLLNNLTNRDIASLLVFIVCSKCGKIVAISENENDDVWTLDIFIPANNTNSQIPILN